MLRFVFWMTPEPRLAGILANVSNGQREGKREEFSASRQVDTRQSGAPRRAQSLRDYNALKTHEATANATPNRNASLSQRGRWASSA